VAKPYQLEVVYVAATNAIRIIVDRWGDRRVRVVERELLP